PPCSYSFALTYTSMFYSLSLHDALPILKPKLRQDQIAFQESGYYRSKSKERYKIETKNSELKNVHGYGRAHSYGVQHMDEQGATDRKSTRLNSSHVKSSYAVFCLKKKIA